jgi:hypothetical protein
MAVQSPNLRSTTPVRVFRRVVTPLLLIACLCPGTALLNADSGAGIWVFERRLPWQRAEVAAVVVNGNLHTIGGNFNNVAVTAHDAFDPDKDAWRTLADLPEARDHVAVA